MPAKGKRGRGRPKAVKDKACPAGPVIADEGSRDTVISQQSKSSAASAQSSSSSVGPVSHVSTSPNLAKLPAVEVSGLVPDALSASAAGSPVGSRKSTSVHSPRGSRRSGSSGLSDRVSLPPIQEARLDPDVGADTLRPWKFVDHVLRILLPVVGNIPCPCEGCKFVLSVKKWDLMLNCMLKHLGKHHSGGNAVSFAISCSECSSQISGDVHLHNCFQSGKPVQRAARVVAGGDASRPVSSRASSGGFVDLTDRRFLEALYGDYLNLGSCIMKRFPNRMVNCRRCGEEYEDFDHLMLDCVTNRTVVREQTDRVSLMLKKYISPEFQSPSGVLPEEVPFGYPPLFLTDGRKLVITGVMLCEDDTFSHLENVAGQRDSFLRLTRCEKLVKSVRESGNYSEIIAEPILISTLGRWDPSNDRIIQSLCPNADHILIRKLLLQAVFRLSRNVVVRHLTNRKSFGHAWRNLRRRLVLLPPPLIIRRPTDSSRKDLEMSDACVQTDAITPIFGDSCDVNAGDMRHRSGPTPSFVFRRGLVGQDDKVVRLPEINLRISISGTTDAGGGPRRVVRLNCPG